MKQQKRFHRISRSSFIVGSAFALLFFTSCRRHTTTHLVFWINNREFVRYVELFNSSHDLLKVTLVYKDNPAAELPSVSHELPPDIVAGPWLRNEHTARYFRPIRTAFNRQEISRRSFYPALLDAGKIGYRQYLLPVSFNLPAVIFSRENADFISDGYTISIDAIKDTSIAFNKKNESDTQFTRMGFSPLNSASFLYLTAKLHGARFQKVRGALNWNDASLAETVAYIRNWTEHNGGTQSEHDFSYKYLSMPSYRQVTTGRCLFTAIRSDQLFSLSSEQTAPIDYRWITHDGKLPIDDSLIMIGIARSCRHVAAAKEFILWLLNSKTQRALIEDKTNVPLDTDYFGIAGGFSSLREINEHILPIRYVMLMSNVPQSDALSPPERLPADWDTVLERVVCPYLVERCGSEQPDTVASLSDRLAEWEKQNFN